MRNLKKILALVLALVMSMSLMATANAFTDDANVDATYDEAVTVLSNLKVFQGYDDGSFQPKGSITRAEVAAIIYRIATGDVTDSQVGIYADYNKFDDVKSTSWYAGYVNYCANAEYIKGYDAKTFGPNDPVTGYQALAMILRAVGYDKNGEFTGSDWPVQTAAVGKQLHITDNISAGTLNTAATREVVAEILFRSILVPQVTYTPALGYQSIGVSSTGNVLTGWFVDNASIGAETFGLAQTTGEITAIDYHDGLTVFTPVNNKNALITRDSVGVINTAADWTKIGYAAYAYTVPTANAKTRTAVSDVVVTGDSLGTSTNGTSFANLTNKNSSSFISEIATNVRYYYNGVACTAQKAATAADNVGVKVDFIDNDEGGMTEVVAITAYTSAYVTAITNENNTGFQGVQANSYYLNNIAVKADNLVCADALAYQDLVTYVAYDGVYYVTKAPLTQDTFNRINRATVGGASYMYVIGETEYLVSAKALKTELISANLGKAFDVYTDPYGHVIYAAPTSANLSYMFVLANDHTVATTGLTNARIVNTDGSIADVSINFNGIVEVNQLAGHMYGYTVNADGSYKVVKCSDLTNVSYDKKTATMYGAEGNRGVNNTTVVVDLRGVTVNSSAATAVYTGYNEIPTFTGGELHYVAVNGWITFAFLTNGIADLTNNFIVFDTGINGETVIDNQHYYYLDVIVNGELKEDYQLTAKEYGYIDTYGVGEYSITKTGVLKEYTAFPEEWVTATWTNGGLYVKNTDTYYTYADGIPFVVLDITNGAATNYGMIQGRDYNVYLRKDNTSIKEIYIVVGEVAKAETLNVSVATWVKDNATYTYYVKDRMITGYISNVFTTSAPSVVLEGETNVPAFTYAGDNTFTATVPYSTWKNWVDKNFVITPAKGNQISVTDRVSFTTDPVKVGVMAPRIIEDGGVQTIVVYSQSLTPGTGFTGTQDYTFVITYQAAGSETALTSKNEKVATVDNDNSVINVLDRNLSINEFMANFEAPQGAKVEWTFENAQGVVAEKDYFQTMQNVTDFSVKVTAQDGKTTKTYEDQLSAAQIIADLEQYETITADNKAAAQAAVDAAKVLVEKNNYTDAEKAAIEAAIKAVEDAIADYDAGVDATEAYNAAVAAAKAALKGNNKVALTEAAAQLEGLTGLTAKQQKVVDGLLADIAAKLDEIAYDAAITAADEALAGNDVAAMKAAVADLQNVLNTQDLTTEEIAFVNAKIDALNAAIDAIENPPVDEFQALLNKANAALEAGINSKEEYEAATAIVAELKDMIKNGSLTQAQRNQLVKARNGLNTAISDYEAAQAALEAAKPVAKDALAAYYNGMNINRSDEDAAKAIYDAAIAAIDSAATVDAVNSLRDEAILALSKLDQNVAGSKTELAKALAAAGTQTNEIVAILKAEGATVLEQAHALYAVNTSNNMDVILPVLYAAGYSVEDIYAGYIANRRDVADITKALADAEAPAEAIVAGYVNYWMTNQTGLTGVTVTPEADGSFTVAVKSTGSISGTGMQKLLANCGLTAEEMTVTWTSGNSGKTDSADFATFVASKWTNIFSAVKGNSNSFKMVIAAGELTCNINLVYAA